MPVLSEERAVPGVGGMVEGERRIRPALWLIGSLIGETEDHPRRAAPMWGWFAVFALAGGVFGLRTAVSSGRRGGVWWRRTPIRAVFGVSSALATAGLLGSLGQILAGGTAWPGVVAGALGLALGTAGAIRARRRAAAGAAVGSTDLDRYG